MFDLARWRKRWPAVDGVLAVNDRFGAIGGGPLSSSIALAAFASLFPLILVMIAVVGFRSTRDADFTASVVDTLALDGRAADLVRDAVATAEGTRRAASVIGVVGLVWAGLAVVGALQNAFNAAWQVSGRGPLDKLIALRWLVGAGTMFLATVALGPVLGMVAGAARPLTIAAGVTLTTTLFLWTYSTLGNSHVGWRVHIPGAVLVGVGFEILKAIGSIYVPRAVASSSGLYGSLGVVFALLAWFVVYGRLIVYGAVLNVVRYEARAGTVTVDIEVPRIEGEVPLSATRGGAVKGSRIAG